MFGTGDIMDWAAEKIEEFWIFTMMISNPLNTILMR
jgi:hypothetical protein